MGALRGAAVMGAGVTAPSGAAVWGPGVGLSSVAPRRGTESSGTGSLGSAGLPSEPPSEVWGSVNDGS